jgi:putative membrane protein
MKRWPRLALWLGFAVLLTLAVAFGGGTGPVAQSLAAISITVLAVHAVIGLGWIEAAAFAAICLTVTFTMENVGVLTGFPYGRYVFLVEPDLPHVGVIPPIVGPLYFGLGYASWVIANVLLGERMARPSRFGLLALPILSAFVMTQWDVVMDPEGSTLDKAWMWLEGGGYFGVPLSNFLGWFLVTWLYFQGFALLAYARRNRGDYRRSSPLFWAIPVLLYLAAGLCHLPLLIEPDASVVDQGGRVWSAAALRQTTAIVMLFTMTPTALLALLRLAPLRNGEAIPQTAPQAPKVQAS